MYACIDLGSNSFHLLIARQRNGKHDIIERFSDKVQLGEGIASTLRITPAAFARGLACLERFQSVLATYPVEYQWAVGTNALRLAGNADEFLAAARERGFDIDVVSGLEEAALIYAGVVSALPASDEKRLVFDIGGGSTELIVGQGHQRLLTRSMQIGCVGWRDLWFQDVPTERKALRDHLNRASDAAAAVFQEAAGDLSAHSWQRVYASSGTAKMFDAICQQRSDFTAGQAVSRDALLTLESDILRTALDPDFQLPGLRSTRRDLLLPGWAVLNGLMQAAGISSLQFSPTALREGMLHYLAKSAVSHASPLSALKAGGATGSAPRH